jgi:polysaccharide export outer membrane protein
MIARFVSISAAALLLVGCSARLPLVAFAQEKAPAPAAAPDSSAAASAADDGTAAPASATPTAPADGASVEPVVVDANAFRIGPEDVLDVYVRNDRELGRVVPVRPDGKISLPLVNDVQAAGLTTEELRLRLTQEFKRFFENPEVSVGMKEMHSVKISVQGNVRMPGQYEVKSEQTVLDLIARAQGFNEFADKGNIRILRKANGRQESIKFRYGAAVDGDAGANFPVKPGDIIIVG